MVALVLAYAIMLYFSNVMARTASTALFFGEYDADTLPYTSLFLMVVGPLVSFVYLRLNNNFTLSKVLLGIHGLLLFTLILLPLLLGRISSSYLTFSLPIYFGVNNSLTISSFWNLLGRIYNLRQGKRLFGLLSSGEHMATIVSGFMAPLFVARIGTINLYWIGAFFMAGAIVLLVLINHKNAEKMDSALGEKGESKREAGLISLAKDPYIRLIFALFTLFIIGIYTVNNISFQQAEVRFPTADEMAGYIGIFMGIFGVLSLIVQWFLAGRLLERFGVRSMILATPGGLFIFMTLFAFVGTFTNWTSALFWLAVSAAMYQSILDAADSAAINLMYQPLPAQLRTQVQTTVIGIVYPLAIGFAGLLLVLLLDGLGFSAVQLAYAALVVIAVWLYIGLHMGRAYPDRLRQALREYSLGGLASWRPDQDSIPILEEALSSANPAIVQYALDMLEDVAPQKAAIYLPALLDNPDQAVQAGALERIGALSWVGTPPGVPALLANSENAHIRAAALRTWYRIDEKSATEELQVLSGDSQLEVRQEALAIMRQHDLPAFREQARERLAEMVAEGDGAQRAAAARVIGQTADPGDAGLLNVLLEDENTAVRHAALEAAASLRSPETWPLILPVLAQSDGRILATAALAAGGEEILSLLETVQEAANTEPGTLAGIAVVYGRIGSPRSAVALQKLIFHADLIVRNQALVALSTIACPAEVQDHQALERQLGLERQEILETMAAQIDLGNGEAKGLAAGALEQKRRLLADNLLLLLSFLYDREGILSARGALLPRREVDDEKSAYAVEVLDILIDLAHKQMLLPFFQELAPEEQHALVEAGGLALLGRHDRLLAMLQPAPGEMERWLRICAIYDLGHAGSEEVIEAITQTAVREDADALLLDTALNSLQTLGANLPQIASANPSLVEAITGYPVVEKQQMSTLQKIAFLKNVSIFSHLPDGALLPIANLLVEETVPTGQMIMRKGDQGDLLYLVVDGRLRVHDGEQTIDTLGSGGVAGEMALLDLEPRSASVTAETPSRLLRLEQEPFFELLAGQPELARDLMALLSRRLRERADRLPPVREEKPALPVLPPAGAQPGTAGSIAIQAHLLDLDKVFVLKRIELFGTSDNVLLGQLALLLDERDLAGGEVLFQQGDPGQSLYIVAAGQVRVHIGDQTLAYLGEGEIFGEKALLDSEPRLATVTAVVPSQLLRLEQKPFFELLESQPQLARGLITMLSSRLRSRLAGH